jgi:hypothetical protein
MFKLHWDPLIFISETGCQIFSQHLQLLFVVLNGFLFWCLILMPAIYLSWSHPCQLTVWEPPPILCEGSNQTTSHNYGRSHTEYKWNSCSISFIYPTQESRIMNMLITTYPWISVNIRYVVYLLICIHSYYLMFVNWNFGYPNLIIYPIFSMMLLLLLF